jgi:hypothetical protein
MGDDSKKAPEPKIPALGKRIIAGAPKSVFVKGGTTSSAHDKAVKAQWLESERRRAEADMERRIADVPIEKGGGVQFTNQLNTQDERDLQTGKVELFFVNSRGEQEYESGEPLRCLADVIVPDKPERPSELMLIMICPKCKERGLPADQAIIQIRQSNREWDLDQRRVGEPIIWDEWVDGPDGLRRKKREVYLSAGIVRDGEKFTCPRCNWRAVIDDNKVWTLRT